MRHIVFIAASMAAAASAFPVSLRLFEANGAALDGCANHGDLVKVRVESADELATDKTFQQWGSVFAPVPQIGANLYGTEPVRTGPTTLEYTLDTKKFTMGAQEEFVVLTAVAGRLSNAGYSEGNEQASTLLCVSETGHFLLGEQPRSVFGISPSPSPSSSASPSPSSSASPSPSNSPKSLSVSPSPSASVIPTFTGTSTATPSPSPSPSASTSPSPSTSPSSSASPSPSVSPSFIPLAIKAGITKGGIAGAVIGSFLGALLLAFIAWFVVVRTRTSDEDKEAASAGTREAADVPKKGEEVRGAEGMRQVDAGVVRTVIPGAGVIPPTPATQSPPRRISAVAVEVTSPGPEHPPVPSRVGQ